MDLTEPAPDPLPDTYARLVDLLEAGGARYRFIDHAPEGQTAAASRLRGHPLAQAAKSIVVRVSLTRRCARYVLAVVPGTRRVDLDAVSRAFGGRGAAFATQARAEHLAGSVAGTIMPFAFDPGLALVADPALFDESEIYFNAARLDLSVALDTDDYARLGDPEVHPIAGAEAVPEWAGVAGPAAGHG